MPLTSEQKLEFMKTYGASQTDTGSAEVQIAMLTQRILELTEHLKLHSKDFATRRGLIKMVGRRRRMLNYLKDKRTPEVYKDLLTKLNLRK
jgi:small subunit ribosomal protein S15